MAKSKNKIKKPTLNSKPVHTKKEINKHEPKHHSVIKDKIEKLKLKHHQIVKKKVVQVQIVKKDIKHPQVHEEKNKIEMSKLKIKKPQAKKKIVKPIPKEIPVLNLKTDSDIAMDFATKVYLRFNKLIKSVILFGSVAKKTAVPGSDIDIIVLIDDASIGWDQELISWYREELEKLVRHNPYKKALHINTIKLTTWWEDLLKGDPIVMNIIRDGESLIDFGGFFEPLKYLLVNGKIRATPEAIYSLLARAPQHIMRSKVSELNAIEGLYWGMIDSAQAALISMKVQPSSPENIPFELKKNFVNDGKLKMKYAVWLRDLLMLHKKILHKEIVDLKGIEIDDWHKRTEEFLEVMAKLVNDTLAKS